MTPSLFDVSVAVNVTAAGHATLSAELSTARVAVVMANDDDGVELVEVVSVVVDDAAKGLGNPAQAAADRARTAIPDHITNLAR